MSAEAYSVAFEKANYHAPTPEAFDKEVVRDLRESAIRDNLLSYAGEYRLGVKFDEYYYREEEDPQTGERYLASNGPGPVREIYRKAIKNREEQGFSVRREVAECLGFETLERQLLDSPDGTMAVWTSPPGDLEDGYGGYSFTFIGQKEGQRIRMIPYRNINTLKEHSQQISEVTGLDVNFKSDVEALSSPFIINPREGLEQPEDILKLMGENEAFDVTWKRELEEKAQPFIDAFLYFVKTNASDEELIKVRNAFENFAIAFRENREIEHIEMEEEREFRMGPLGFVQTQIDKWGYEPPIVRGSCGPTIEQKSSSSTPMEFQESFGIIGKDKYGERAFNCPACNKENVRPYNKLIPKCQHCGSDKVACRGFALEKLLTTNYESVN